MKTVANGAKAIVAGSQHSMMLKEDGSVWTTGCNIDGQLGHRSNSGSTAFVEVMSSGAALVAAGAFHSMVVMQDGSVWATGSNKFGQFGDGSTKSQIRFVRIKLIYNGTGIIRSPKHALLPFT